MFRKLQDRLTAAANATGLLGDNNNTGNDVARLTALGFSPSQAQSALQATNGDVDRAAELLLLQQTGSDAGNGGGASATTTSTANASQEEQDLQRALQQSMIDAQAQHRPQRTAAMIKAAEAAERRAAVGIQYGTGKNKTVQAAAARTAEKSAPVIPVTQQRKPPPVKTPSATLRVHHPDVQLVPKLQDKSVEERILRTADRMKSHPAAVDTLTRALQLLQNNPDNPKYRRIDTASPGFQRSVAPAPGALDFLKTMGFAPEYSNNSNSNVLILHRPLYDPALVYLGLSALQQTQLTTEYVNAKQQLDFQKELQQLLQPTPSQQGTEEQRQQEQLKRAQLRKQLPNEPPSGALLQISLGLQHTTIRRRFDADDTVADLLNWLGATQGTAILDKVLTQEWCLVDVNRNPVAVLRVDPPDQAKRRTLQYVGCWPSGRLELRPTALVTTAGDAAASAGASRALASAASGNTE